MKFGMLSSGFDPRPAKGEPAQPVVSLATAVATSPAMRRRASEWAVGYAATKFILILGAQDVGLSEGESSLPVRWARGESTRRGVRPRHADKRTAQAPGRPTFFLEKIRNYGAPVIQLRRAVRPWRRAQPADPTHVGIRKEQASTSRYATRKGRPKRWRRRAGESEGRIGALTSGNEVALGPGRAKAARVARNVRRKPCPMR